MNSPEMLMAPTDALAEVELRIARRADELCRLEEGTGKTPYEHWRQAEDEVWRNPKPIRPAVAPLP